MEQLLTTTEAAQQLGVVPATLLGHIHAGRLAAIRVGRQWVITSTALAAFSAARPPRRGGPTQSSPIALRRLAGEGQVLTYVAQHPGATAGEIATVTGQTRRLAQRRLQSLEADGFIYRTEPTPPSRPWPCHVTEAGWAELTKAQPQEEGAA
ncbi:MAG: helix-turn-helix domain-containing protein [Acidimicrobiales bacterium]